MRCPECGNTNVWNNGIEVVCRQCGLVVEENCIETPHITDVQRDNAQHLFKLRAGTQPVGGRIVKSNWTYSHTEKKQSALQEEVNTICDKMHLGESVSSEAERLITQLQELNVLDGNKSEDIAIACVYTASLLLEQPRTHLDFEQVFGIDRFVLLRKHKFVVNKLNLVRKRYTVPELIDVYVARLNINPIFSHVARNLWTRIKAVPKIQAKPSYVVASALVYAVSNKTQREVSQVTGAIETSMRRVLKFL